MTDPTATPVAFSDLELPDFLLRVLTELGYESPSPIQSETIPLLLEGRDVLGQAQTGTGKTAAFALPALAKLELKKKHTQVLVLAPTRELAIQVAEAFQTYARYLKGFNVLPIYGGTPYSGQLRQLKQGAQVVVGTPGRVMDHIRRGTLQLSQLQCLVLDEADEMLRMGFIDDVEWILEQTPNERQIALFSATMPREVKRIAQKHLSNPAEVVIKVKTTTAPTIRQRYWPVSGTNKLDALTRILEAEDFDGVIIFTRTKIQTVELSDKLRARGYKASPLNGDVVQAQREKTIVQLKRGAIDILVATDVAARGLDVERISHVMNYDIPTDTESYVHRIGRTGRAGRSGEAILFVAPREKRMLFAIEKASRQTIERMELPSTKIINDKRIAKFKQKITETIEQLDTKPERIQVFTDLIAQFQHETESSLEKIAAALAVMAQDGKDLLIKDLPPAKKHSGRDGERGFDDSPSKGGRREGRDRNRGEGRDRSSRGGRDGGKKRSKALPEGMERFRIDVGHEHNIMPGNIVGAIANEADMDSQFIGHIAIHDDYSTVDLPKDLANEKLSILKKSRVSGKPMNLRKDTAQKEAGYKKTSGDEKPRAKKPKKKKDGPKKEGSKVLGPKKPRSKTDLKKSKERSKKREAS